MEPGEENKKISLSKSKEKETLFITLKAEDGLSANSILHDDTASKILTEVNYDSAKFEKSDDSGTVVGASQFDEWFISLFLVVDWFYCG